MNYKQELTPSQELPPPSPWRKRLPLILALVFGLCACTGLVTFGLSSYLSQALGEALITDPEGVATQAAQIVTYDLPAGYKTMFAISVFSLNMAAVGPDTPPGLVFMFMQLPANTQSDSIDYQKQMRDTLSQQSAGEEEYQFQPIGEAEYTIRGQEITMTISEGQSANGNDRMRQMIGIFSGDGGEVMLMVSGEPENWDETLIAEFFSSIR